MTDIPFKTAAQATEDAPRQAVRVGGAINRRSTDIIVSGLRKSLDAIRTVTQEDDRPLRHAYGFARVECQRVFRKVDSEGRFQSVEEIIADEIDGVLVYIINGDPQGYIFPGDFPGNITETAGQNFRSDPNEPVMEQFLIFAGRYSGTGRFGFIFPHGSKLKLFKGNQIQSDPEVVSNTGVDDRFIGKGRSWFWSRFVFQESNFNGEPGPAEVIVRGKKCVDPRNETSSSTFSSAAKSFSINNYVHIFDYLVRPEEKGGQGISFDLIDLESFQAGSNWADMRVETQQFSRLGLFTSRSNNDQGTAPNNTNHIVELNETVCPFGYGDIVKFSTDDGQTLPTNISPGQEYYVIPVRPLTNVFQFPAFAIAETLADSLAGVSVPFGTWSSDIIVTKVAEIRYQSSVVYDAGESILPAMLDSCGASLFLKQGKIAITQQRFPDSVDRVDLDEFIGPIALSTSSSDEDRATELVGKYKGITTLFLPRDYPAVNGNGTFKAIDRKFVSKDYDLLNVPKPSQAQRLATIQLRKLRQELTSACSGDLSLFRLTPGVVTSLDFSKYGLDEATTFEVQSQTLFVRTSNGKPTVNVDVRLRQLESSTFDLDLTSEEFQETVDIPGLESPFDVDPPGTPSVREELFVAKTGGGAKSRAVVTWAASPGAFITGYEVQFKLSASDDYTTTAQTPDTRIEINDLAPGLYDFRIIAVSSGFGKSDPSLAEVTNFEISGLSARPSAPSNFQGQVLGISVQLRWSVLTDIDVLEGGQVEIRHSPETSGAEAKNSVLLDFFPGSSTSCIVPFKQGTYFIRAKDSSGQFSDASNWVTQDRRPVTLAQLPTGVDGAFENAGDEGTFTLQEDSTFPSTNPSNTLVFDTDHLELPLEDTFDDEADVDAISNIDEVGGGAVVSEGFYYFNTDVEIDASREVIVEAVIATEVFDLSASLDDEVNFDQISDVDSVASALLDPGLANAEMQVRFSPDPVASDTFGPWETVDTQLIRARSFQFRVRAESTKPTVNIRINQARVRMKLAPT